jgi:hypothetical protein
MAERTRTVISFSRMDKVIAHIERFAPHNEFYRSLLKQWTVLHRLSDKQVIAVESNMDKDLKRLRNYA